ncbi:uncharacterized protein METZ01_LOCUS391967 [marine metagenome]|uniref:ClpX-type ZB domain-containing protein n=1 Tax=marine metagenome TaxID=408172 RepID=A0A382UXX6_9ZZZZ
MIHNITAFSIWCENCGDDVNSKSDLEVAFGMHVCKRCVEHFRYPDKKEL